MVAVTLGEGWDGTRDSGQCVHLLTAHNSQTEGSIPKKNKTIRDGGITVDFRIIKVHTSN